MLPMLILLCIAVVVASSYWLEVTVYRVKSAKIPAERPLKIALISDLHGHRLGRHNRRLVSEIKKCGPDVVIMAGDMTDDDSENQELLRVIDAFEGSFPIYYTKGNHEQRLSIEEWDKLQNALTSRGVHMLNNENYHLEEHNIRLYGAWSDKIYRRDPGPAGDDTIFSAADLSELVGKSTADNYNLLVIHTPAYFKAYRDWGADLALSGHMHGGLIRLPFIGGLLSPYRRLLPAYAAGKHTENGSDIIIGRGLGNGKKGFRLFCRPELVVIELSAADKAN